MIIVIFGPPGSGKGTQSNILITKYNLQLISVGDMLRAIILSESDLGNKIKDIIQSGNLVQDEIICDLLQNQLMSMNENLLLDGFPRNLKQAYFLSQILINKYNKDVDYVIELQVKDEIVIERMKNRFICLDCKNTSSTSDLTCSKCNSNNLKRRDDDINTFAVRRRIDEYYIQMKNLREYYKEKLLTVDASLDVDKVTKEITAKISSDFI